MPTECPVSALAVMVAIVVWMQTPDQTEERHAGQKPRGMQEQGPKGRRRQPVAAEGSPTRPSLP